MMPVRMTDACPMPARQAVTATGRADAGSGLQPCDFSYRQQLTVSRLN
ncbi:Uncharacterised protein [Shigella sonnei]|nr:Uncharacterised protein [Shigella sonnei]